MAKIKVKSYFNLPLIAEAAGDADFNSRYYRDGFLYVDSVSQKSLNDALNSYNHDVDKPRKIESDIEAIKRALKTKGLLSASELKRRKK